MDADRQPRLDGGLVDRPIALAPERLTGAAQQQDLGKAAVAGATADFARGGLRVLIGDDDRRLEALVAPRKALELAFIAREGERRGKLGVLLALAGRCQGVHDPMRN